MKAITGVNHRAKLLSPCARLMNHRNPGIMIAAATQAIIKGCIVLPKQRGRRFRRAVCIILNSKQSERGKPLTPVFVSPSVRPVSSAHIGHYRYRRYSSAAPKRRFSRA